MDDHSQTPLPVDPVDEDLLYWMPPELVERARRYEQRDTKTNPPPVPRKKRIDFTVPPKGRHRLLSLSALAGGALLLLLSACLSATGATKTQAIAEKGSLWFALWLTGQIATLCIYLLCLLPLRKKMRRLALLIAMSAGFGFGLTASLTVMLRGDRSDVPLAFEIATVIISVLVAIIFSPNSWLIVGALRCKTTEKFSVLMGGINLAVIMVSLVQTLASGRADTSTVTTALSFAQGLCFLCLLASWPVLERAVLDKTG